MLSIDFYTQQKTVGREMRKKNGIVIKSFQDPKLLEQILL